MDGTANNLKWMDMTSFLLLISNSDINIPFWANISYDRIASWPVDSFMIKPTSAVLLLSPDSYYQTNTKKYDFDFMEFYILINSTLLFLALLIASSLGCIG